MSLVSSMVSLMKSTKNNKLMMLLELDNKNHAQKNSTSEMVKSVKPPMLLLLPLPTELSVNLPRIMMMPTSKSIFKPKRTLLKDSKEPLTRELLKPKNMLEDLANTRNLLKLSELLKTILTNLSLVLLLWPKLLNLPLSSLRRLLK